MKTNCFVTLILLIFFQSSYSALWEGLNPMLAGSDSSITQVILEDNGELYFLSKSTGIGNVISSGVTKWNGTEWTPLCKGLTGYINKFEITKNSNIIASGRFNFFDSSHYMSLAEYDGNVWTQIGDTIWTGNAAVEGGDFSNRRVEDFSVLPNGSIAVMKTEYQFVGDIDEEFSYCAVWNGEQWSTIPQSIKGKVLGVSSNSKNQIIAYGEFQEESDTIRFGIALWDGSQWVYPTIPNYHSGEIYKVELTSRGVFVCGYLDVAGNNYRHDYVKFLWKENEWNDISYDFKNRVNAFEEGKDNNFYAFEYDFWTKKTLKKLVDTNWIEIADTLNKNIKDIAIYPNGEVIAVGEFEHGNGIALPHIARLKDSVWHPFSNHGINSPLNNVIVFNNSIIASGNGNCILNILDDSIDTIGTPFNESIKSIATWNGSLYTAGNFTISNGLYHSRIAQWDGSTWIPVGQYATSGITKLASFENKYLYGVTEAGTIIKWDGLSWQEINVSLIDSTSQIYDILPIGEDSLLIGGSFNTLNVDGEKVKGITLLNSNKLHSLNGGVDGKVHAIHIFKNKWTIGGSFRLSNVNQNIAFWENGKWNHLSNGTSGPVNTLSSIKDSLFVGGDFRGVDEYKNVTNIAIWDDTLWGRPRRDINGTVKSLVIKDNSDLVIIGDFTIADSAFTPFIAKYDLRFWDIPILESINVQLPILNIHSSSKKILLNTKHAGVINFKLVNLKGQILQETNISSSTGITSIDLDRTIAPGIYTVYVKIGEFYKSKRIRIK